MCKCKNYPNSHGENVKSSETSMKRKRYQQMDLPCSKKFASDSGEDVAHVLWSNFETLVVNWVVVYHTQNQIMTPTRSA